MSKHLAVIVRQQTQQPNAQRSTVPCRKVDLQLKPRGKKLTILSSLEHFKNPFLIGPMNFHYLFLIYVYYFLNCYMINITAQINVMNIVKKLPDLTDVHSPDTWSVTYKKLHCLPHLIRIPWYSFMAVLFMSMQGVLFKFIQLTYSESQCLRGTNCISWHQSKSAYCKVTVESIL